ncbi:MAG: SDR family oxidoreductase [Chlamydiae bacterium]|nr:SDR family oxidoreductase [Chlamydiota bacterium]
MQKIYAIFGATGGIGSKLASHLSDGKNKIYLLGRNKEKLEALSLKLSEPYILVDPLSEESVASALSEIVKNEGRIDAVASLIGSVFLKPLQSTSQKEFEEVMKVNAVSSFCILKHALNLMQSGSIVLSSSTASLIGMSHHEAIASAKSAINGLVRSAAASYASRGIRVNAVAPGLTKTNQTSFITNNELSLKASIKFHPLGRIAEPEEVASLIAWLLSDQSGFITGNVIAVDGGLSSIKLQ